MAITLARSYAGVPAGNTVQLPAELEASLIAQGYGATAARTAITTGAQAQNTMSGTAAVAAGASSVVVTNALVDANTQINARVAQASADGTLLRVERVVAAAGSFTIYGTANATATTLIDWQVVSPAQTFART